MDILTFKYRMIGRLLRKNDFKINAKTKKRD